MTSSSWSLDMVPPIWTKTAFSWKRALRESTLRSDIQRHFSLERLITSCSDFRFCIILSSCLYWVAVFYACHRHLKQESTTWSRLQVKGLACEFEQESVPSQVSNLSDPSLVTTHQSTLFISPV